MALVDKKTFSGRRKEEEGKLLDLLTTHSPRSASYKHGFHKLMPNSNPSSVNYSLGQVKPHAPSVSHLYFGGEKPLSK